MENAKNFADYLQVLLRYIASGFVAVMLVAYVNDDSYTFCKGFLEKSPWTVLVIAGTIGVLIYSIHHAVLDTFFYVFAIFLYRLRRNVPVKLIDAVTNYRVATVEKYATTPPKKGSKNYWRLKFELFTQCYLRKSSKVDYIILIQQELEKKLALLNFLYCCFYSCTLIVIVAVYKRYWGSTTLPVFNTDRVYQVAIFAVILLLAAICYDYQITKREFWLIETCFQEAPVYDKPAAKDHNPENPEINTTVKT